MTEKLYDLNAYQTEFEAMVLSCEKNDDNTYSVELDKTLFFPEEGGQSPDKGKMNGIDVVDVQISKSGIITHKLSEALEAGTTVKGVIDWEHRFSNMQQHSGEHIFSGLVNSTYGYDNVGFHLSDQIVTMDFSGPLTMEQALEIEERANRVITSNVNIKTGYPSKEEIAKLEYRSKIEIDGPVRIVEVEGVDICACCAPHVRLTGEIGILKIMNMQNYKGGVRISILCGKRALMAFREKNFVVQDLMTELCTAENDLLTQVKKIKSQSQTYKQELTGLKKSVVLKEIEGIPDSEKNVVLFLEGLDANTMRPLVNILTAKHEGICGIFNGNDADGYNFILSSSSLDMKDIATLLREKLKAKCGGSKEMIQGSVNAAEMEIMELVKSEE